MLVTRFAPTPSGFLHPGNAVNALLTVWLARASGGRLLLRIDDFDTVRLRPAYLEDVFETLAWLGIVVDGGPRNPEDFRASWSMGRWRADFAAARDRLLADHSRAVFVCRCSRAALDPVGRCAAGCRQAGHRLRTGESAVRLAVPDGARVQVGGRPVAVPAGDHVLWRRDDLPAYLLGSVVADELLGVTAVVRGVDLLAASALQLHLAELLPAPGFQRADLRHHGLVTAPDGTKLSKSAGAQAHPMARTAAVRAAIEQQAAELGAPIGIRPP